MTRYAFLLLLSLTPVDAAAESPRRRVPASLACPIKWDDGTMSFRWDNPSVAIPAAGVEIAYLRPPPNWRINLDRLEYGIESLPIGSPVILTIADDAGLVLHRTAIGRGGAFTLFESRPFIIPIAGRGLVLTASCGRPAILDIHVGGKLEPLP